MDYLSQSGTRTGSRTGGTATLTSATITFTAGPTVTGNTLGAGGPNTFTYVPAANITDAAGNTAAGSFAKLSFRIF